MFKRIKVALKILTNPYIVIFPRQRITKDFYPQWQVKSEAFGFKSEAQAMAVGLLFFEDALSKMKSVPLSIILSVFPTVHIVPEKPVNGVKPTPRFSISTRTVFLPMEVAKKLRDKKSQHTFVEALKQLESVVCEVRR